MNKDEIEEFISSLCLKSNAEQKRYRRDLNEFFVLLKELGLAEATEAVYKEFRKRKIQAKPDITNETLYDRENRVRKFFKFKKELQITMPEELTVMPEVIDEPKPEAVAKAKKSNAGRKKKEGNYTERIMIYVTPEMKEQIEILANATKTPQTDFIVKILEKHLAEYEEKISAFLEQQKIIQNLFSK